MSHSGTPDPTPSPGQRLIDQISRRFERDWQQLGQRPAIESYVVLIEKRLQADLLCELIVIELELDAATGLSNSIDHYLDRFHEHTEVVHRAFVEARSSLDEHLQSMASSRIPTCMGEFQIIREVGRGGMGIVFEAVQQSLHRRVALKVLPLHYLSRPERVIRFQQEATAIARLHHSHIVQVYGVGEAGGNHFFAMQFIDGSSLDAIIRGPRDSSGVRAFEMTDRFDESTDDGPVADLEQTVDCAAKLILDEQYAGVREANAAIPHMSAFKVARIGKQVAEALAYAHDRGILHRDIKPSNLMLDNDDNVWLTDFGLAKVVDDEERDLTSSGDMIGTLRYLAPEAINSEWTERSDIYSLGATLYEMLIGEPAFRERDRSNLIESITRGVFVTPRRQISSIPKRLETIILKALNCDPQNRYSTAHEFAEDLDLFNRGQPIRAQRSTFVTHLVSRIQRNRHIAALSLSLVCVLLIGLVVSLSFWHQALDAKDLAKHEHSLAVDAAEKANASHLDLVQTHSKLKRANAETQRERQETRDAQIHAEQRLAESFNLMGIAALDKHDIHAALTSSRLAKNILDRTPNSVLDRRVEVLPIREAIDFRVKALERLTSTPVLQTTIKQHSNRLEKFRTRRPNFEHWLSLAFENDDSTIVVQDRVSGIRMRTEIESGRTIVARVRGSNDQQVSCDANHLESVKLNFSTKALTRIDLKSKSKIERTLHPGLDDERLVEIQLSPNRQYLCVVTVQHEETKFRVWDPADKLLWQHDLDGTYHDAAFSLDSSMLYVAGRSIIGFDTADFEKTRIARLKLSNAVTRLTPTSRGVIASSTDGAVFYKTPEQLPGTKRGDKEIDWDKQVLTEGSSLQTCFVIDERNQRFIAGRSDGVIEFQSFSESVAGLNSVSLNRAPIRHLALSSTGALFVADSTGLTGMWNVNSGMRMDLKLPRQESNLSMQSNDLSTSYIKSISERASKPLATVKWSNNGRLLATLNTQGELTVLDVGVDQCQPIATRVVDFSESKTQEWLAYCHADELNNHRLVISKSGGNQTYSTAIDGMCKSCGLSPNGQRAVAIIERTESEPNSKESIYAIFFEVKDHALELAGEIETDHGPRSSPALFSSNSMNAYVLDESGIQFNFQDRTLPPLTSSKARFKSAAFSPDGRRLVRLFEFNQMSTHMLQILDLSTYHPSVMRVERQHVITSVEFLDANKLLIAGDRGISLVDLSSETVRDLLVHGRRPGISLMKFHPTKPLVLCLTFESEILVVDTETHQSLGMPFQVVGDVVSVGFGPVPGSAIVVTRRNGIQIWDWTRGQPLTPKMFVDERIVKANIRSIRNANRLDRSEQASPRPNQSSSSQLESESIDRLEQADPRSKNCDMTITVLTESGELRNLKSLLR